MIEKDTIKLLRECDAGVKMGISSINDVIDYVYDKNFKNKLLKCKEDHSTLKKEIEEGLSDFHDDGKDPNPIAKGMSVVETNVKLIINESDATIADLMTKGCNMGIKSLNKYLNQYKAADERTKDIAKKLIKQEEKLVKDIAMYL